jgi:hypothetical protein
MTTGSMMNHLMGNSTPATPEVGMGATQLCGSDRHAYTVIEVLSPKKIRVQADKATRTDKNGMSEQQKYTFAPNPEGSVVTLTLRKNGCWIAQGESIKGIRYALGYRSEYHDYSF